MCGLHCKLAVYKCAVQEDLLGTEVISMSFMSITCLSTGAARMILVTALELQEDWGGTITGNVY